MLTRSTHTRITACLSAATAAMAATLILTATSNAAPLGGAVSAPRSAYGNLMKQMAAVQAGEAAPTTNGVPVAASATGVFNASGTECGAPGYIQTKYGGLYVSTELGFGGNLYAMLRARATAIGAWEYYQLCYNRATGHWAIWADANSRWVSAELGDVGGQYGMLRARSGSVGPWELFVPYSANGLFEFKSAANQKWVSTEFGDGGNEFGMLRARSNEIGEWELYWSTIL